MDANKTQEPEQAAQPASMPDAQLKQISYAFKEEAGADNCLRDGQERLTALDYFKRGWLAARSVDTDATGQTALSALLARIDDAREALERHGEVCEFEGQSMIYASTLTEIIELRAALAKATGSAA